MKGKMKFNLNGDSIKRFLSRHVEKIVLGVAVVMIPLLVLSGMKHERVDESLRPEALKQLSGFALENVNRATWEEVEIERFPEPDNYPDKSKRDTVAVASIGYDSIVPWDQLIKPQRAKRGDPQLFAVYDLEVSAHHGAICFPRDSGAAGGVVAGAGDGDGGGGNLQGIEKGFRPGGDAFAQGFRFVSVRGLVPTRRQLEEYRSMFLNSDGYDEQRDLPNYIYYYVERAELAADGTQSPWTRLNTRNAMTLAGRWCSGMPHVADLAYAPENSAIIFPPPPVPFRNPIPFLLHSKVPMRKPAAEEAAGGGEQPPPVMPPDGARPDLPGDVPGGDGAGEGDAGIPGAGGGGADNAAPAAAEVKLADYQLFRFFDFDVLPGKSYVYRVLLLLEDPNDPRDPALKPLDRILEKDVLARINAKPASANRVFWRETEWSEPSPAVRVPLDHAVLAGKITPARVLIDRIDPRLKIPLADAQADLLALIWDNVKALDVGGDITVGRGSVLNFVKTVSPLDPVNMAPRTEPNYNFKTDNILLDIRGGEEIAPIDRKNQKLTSPGSVLLLDAEGRLVIRSDVQDYPTYNRLVAPRNEPERPVRPAPGADEGEPMGGGFDIFGTR